MNRATSVFLDGLRVFAAIWIFAHHCVMEFYKDPWGAHGHDAVVIFFVLSGYVIAFSTLGRKNTQVKQYAIARLSRLYSVVIPALILSALVVVLGFMTNPAAYANPADFGGESRAHALGLTVVSWTNCRDYPKRPGIIQGRASVMLPASSSGAISCPRNPSGNGRRSRQCAGPGIVSQRSAVHLGHQRARIAGGRGVD